MCELRTGNTSLVGRRRKKIISRVNRNTAVQQRKRWRSSTVITERPQFWICVIQAACVREVETVIGRNVVSTIKNSTKTVAGRNTPGDN